MARAPRAGVHSVLPVVHQTRRRGRGATGIPHPWLLAEAQCSHQARAAREELQPGLGLSQGQGQGLGGKAAGADQGPGAGRGAQAAGDTRAR